MRLDSSENPSLYTLSGGCRNKLLATLPGEEYQHIIPLLKVVSLRHKQVLYKQGETLRDVYFPGGGACSIMKSMNDGCTAEVATIGSEGMVGAGIFFGDDQSMGEVLVQVEGGDGYAMPARAFMVEMERRNAFFNRVIRYSQALTAQVMQTTACNGLHSAEQRCCRWLLMMRDRTVTDELKLTQEFLSTMLGLRRPTITIVLHELHIAGLVELARGVIRIVNREGLQARSCECYQSIKTTFHRLLPEIPLPA